MKKHKKNAQEDVFTYLKPSRWSRRGRGIEPTVAAEHLDFFALQVCFSKCYHLLSNPFGGVGLRESEDIGMQGFEP